MVDKVSPDPVITQEVMTVWETMSAKWKQDAHSSQPKVSLGVNMSAATASGPQNAQASSHGHSANQTANQGQHAHSVPQSGNVGTSSQPNWLRFMHALTGLILAVGTVYYYTHDTPPNRAVTDQLWLANQGKEADVELAKAKGKLTQASGQPESVSQQSGPIVIGSSGQHLLATGMQFIFSGNGGNSPDAVIAIKQMPTSYSGAFKVFSKGKTSWSPAWSEDPPSYPLAKLLEESRSDEGNVQWMQLFSNGKTQFNM
jgi:hypothetical protein